MSVRLEGELRLVGLATDGAETVITLDVSTLPGADNLDGNSFSVSNPLSPLIDTLASELRQAHGRTNAMLVAGL